jgi:hypothetical protein
MLHRMTARILACVLTLASAPAGVHAAEESASFNVSFGGIRAGVLAFRGEERGGIYTVHGSARASGLLGALFDAEIDTVAQGRVNGNTYTPGMAREVTAEPDKRRERRYDYTAAGVPRITNTPARDARPGDAPAAQQAGTVDTTTAAYAILRDRPAALACDLDLAVFDGRKRHRIVFDRMAGDGMTCSGTYSRAAGFSAEEMSEQRDWPLTLRYARQPDGTLRVERLSFPTSFGTARVTRR